MLGAGEGVQQAHLERLQELPLRSVMREVGAGLAEGLREGAADSGLATWVVVLSGALLGCLLATYLLWRRYRQATGRLTRAADRIVAAEEAGSEGRG